MMVGNKKLGGRKGRVQLLLGSIFNRGRMHICIHVCTYVQVYVCIYAYMSLCLYVDMYVRTDVYTCR